MVAAVDQVVAVADQVVVAPAAAEDQAAVVADRAVGVPAVAVGQVVVAVVDGVDAESTMPLVV